MTASDEPPALLLDEMHHPKLAAQLRERGYDVVAVAGTAELRALSDGELLRWAAEQGRWIVTENVKDFRRLIVQADEAGERCAQSSSPRRTSSAGRGRIWDRSSTLWRSCWPAATPRLAATKTGSPQTAGGRQLCVP